MGSRKFYTNYNLFIILLLILFNAKNALAQDTGNDNIKETLDFNAGEVAYTLSADDLPDGSSFVWKIDGKEVTDGISDGGKTISLKLSNILRKASVTVTSGDSETKTIDFDIEPKKYGEDYDGKHFYADAFKSGTGTKDEPYIISNDMELALLAHDVTNGNAEQMYSGKYFKISADIDLSKGLWMPIGTWTTKTRHFFAGKFDGDGHSIINMHISWTASDENSVEASWGLFSRLYGKASSEDGKTVVTRKDITSTIILNKDNFSNLATGSTAMINPIRILIQPRYLYVLAGGDAYSGYLLID